MRKRSWAISDLQASEEAQKVDQVVLDAEVVGSSPFCAPVSPLTSC